MRLRDAPGAALGFILGASLGLAFSSVAEGAVATVSTDCSKCGMPAGTCCKAWVGWRSAFDPHGARVAAMKRRAS